MSKVQNKPVFVNGDFVPPWEKFKAIRDDLWSNKEIGLLKSNWKKMNDNELSELIGRPQPATTMKRCKLGLYRMDKIERNSMKHWMEKDVEILENNWEKMSDKELAKIFKRSAHSVKLKRIELGLLRGEWNGRKRKTTEGSRS